MSISIGVNGFAGLCPVKLRLVPAQCQAILGHSIVCCRAVLHLPPPCVLPLHLQHSGDLPESSWTLSCTESAWLFMSFGWLSHGNCSDFTGCFFWSCSWFLGTAEPGCSCDLAKGSEASRLSWVNFMGREAAAPWADSGCPAIHCTNCNCVPPSCGGWTVVQNILGWISMEKILPLQSVRGHLSSYSERSTACTQKSQQSFRGVMVSKM